MPYDPDVGNWDPHWQAPLIQNVVHQQIIEDLAKAEVFGMSWEEQRKQTEQALHLLEQRYTTLTQMAALEKRRAMEG